MNFLDEFKKLFANRNISEEKIKNYAADFLMIASLAIFSAAESKLPEEVKKQVQNLVNEKKFDQAFSAVQKSFSSKEWELFVLETIQPLIGEYVNEVVEA